jgi:hypothetical protein
MARSKHTEQLTRDGACTVLSRMGIPRGEDFHVLSSAQVDGLLDMADRFKYRKPKNANGSRARYFHARLQRQCR